jgi:hypothetical protein
MVFAAFGDETVDPRRDNGQRYRAKLEHSIVESAGVEFRFGSQLLLLTQFQFGAHRRQTDLRRHDAGVGIGDGHALPVFF